MTKEEEEDLKKRVDTVEAALKKALEDNELEISMYIDFPKYRELPETVTLALAVFKQEGGIVSYKYTSIKGLPKKKKE